MSDGITDMHREEEKRAAELNLLKLVPKMLSLLREIASYRDSNMSVTVASPGEDVGKRKKLNIICYEANIIVKKAEGK